MRKKSLIREMKEALFPVNFTCDVCGCEVFGDPLCPDCKKEVHFNDGATCPVCGRSTVRPEICAECKDKPPLYKKAVSPLVYDGKTPALIAKFKNGSPYLAEFLGDLIALKLVGFPKIDAIVYVPLTGFSLFRRGYNPSELLAKHVSYLTETPKINGAIVRVKRGKPQKGLSQKERAENVKGAFKVKKRDEIKGKSVLLIDDVLTTGATADEIANLLRFAGAKEVFVATAATVKYPSVTKKALDEDKAKTEKTR